MNRSGMLPSVEELANKTKNTTTQVYLRVKDSTREFFEKQAEIYAAKTASEDEAADKKTKAAESKVTANALMTTLLDTYAENYTEKSGTEFNYRGVRGYLTRQAQILSKAADDVLFNRLFDFSGCSHNYAAWHESADQMYADYLENLKDPNSNWGDIEITFGHSCDLRCNSVGAKAEVEAEHSADFVGLDAQLYIPAEKWPIVAAMAHAFSVKVTGGNETACDLTASVLEKLAEAINAHGDRAELAMAVAEVLADYAEQCDV